MLQRDIEKRTYHSPSSEKTARGCTLPVALCGIGFCLMAMNLGALGMISMLLGFFYGIYRFLRLL